MGSDKSKSTTTVNQSTTPTPTAEETRLNQLDLQLREQNQGALGQVQGNSLNLANLLLQGQQLPGYLQGLPGGISPDVTQSIVDQSLRDIKPSFQQGGILDSGVAASISARTAADIRNQSSQFNVQNLLQLLNLATGNAAQVQQPIIGQASDLGGRLAGLRNMNQSGTTSTSTVTAQNPFITASGFFSPIGQGIGGGIAKKYL